MTQTAQTYTGLTNASLPYVRQMRMAGIDRFEGPANYIDLTGMDLESIRKHSLAVIASELEIPVSRLFIQSMDDGYRAVMLNDPVHEMDVVVGTLSDAGEVIHQASKEYVWEMLQGHAELAPVKEQEILEYLSDAIGIHPSKMNILHADEDLGLNGGPLVCSHEVVADIGTGQSVHIAYLDAKGEVLESVSREYLAEQSSICMPPHLMSINEALSALESHEKEIAARFGLEQTNGFLVTNIDGNPEIITANEKIPVAMINHEAKLEQWMNGVDEIMEERSYDDRSGSVADSIADPVYEPQTLDGDLKDAYEDYDAGDDFEEL